ncbi:MAG: RagB/SusD family nutrient uptake outer membrane protein [Tannerella sp.]|jgi:hypothetical protein|nr:RagB/SusD family nutrient uptake outer membrane protein [Tannerella sp.]
MKLNKNIITGMIAGALAIPAITSCSDFLDETLTTQQNTDYFNTNEGVESMMTGIYYNLRYHFSFEWAFSTTNYGTDEFIVGGDGSNAMWNSYISSLNPEVPEVNINTTHAYDIWNNMYIGISTANTLIQKCENYTGSMKDEALGTAYFMRGFNYFKLVSQYGGVPLKLTPSTTVELEFARASAQEVIEQVLSDLQEAYAKLPSTEAMEGKLTKAAAAHFLAKAYLWRASEINDSWNSGTRSADLDNVIRYASEVIIAHPLANNYRDLWAYTEPDGANEKLSEIVLAAQFTSADATQGSYGNQQHLYFLNIYRDLPGMARDISGGREYQRLRTTYYTYNVYNHLDDSRLWKSFRTKFNCTQASTAGTNATYVAGDRGLMYVLNKPGDTRFPEIWNKETFKDSETDKLVPTVFALYPQGSSNTTNPMEVDTYLKYYAPLSKYFDGSRKTVSQEAGYRDGILARSAEDYLFIAEAYIRKGEYARAVEYINPLRLRAQWKAGEDRADYIDGGAAWNENALGWSVYQAVAGKGTFCDRNSYYESNNVSSGSLNSQGSDLLVTDITSVSNLPEEDQVICQKLGSGSAYDVAMCFLLNEKTREFCGEFYRWEDLARTQTLVARAKAFNKDAAPNIQSYHCLRPIPQTFLDVIQKDGKALTAAEKKAMQNPGY